MKEQSRQTRRMQMAAAMIVVAAIIGVSVGGRRAHGAAPNEPLTVTTLADSGTGSLREAIAAANGTMGKDTITFSVTGTILLASVLPDITDDLDIIGPGATSLTVSGPGPGDVHFRVFSIHSGATVAISELTISNGGGILNHGTLTITNCTVSNNSALEGGGGIASNGNLTIINSTLSGNRAIDVSGLASNGGGVDNFGMLTIINSTLSRNSADGVGGGIFSGSNSELTITNSTLSENSALDGGGIFNDFESKVNIKNSIVANSTSGGNCSNIPLNFHAVGTNFSTDGTCPGFTNSDQLKLLPLALNAPGTTATHALGFGSVAIDAATAGCTDLDNANVATDQRGVRRPIDGNGDGTPQCDVGAYESFFQVQIDIMPGSDSNCFNNDGHGVIPVAILGSASFDVTHINVSTVRLEGMSVKVKGNGSQQFSYQDVNGDGVLDLMMQIQDQDGVFECGTGSATLTGQLLDNTPFQGSDAICIVGPGC